MTLFYLHGFASSPHSTKAQYLYEQFAKQNIFMQIPDLNQDDFPNLTLTRQIKQVSALFPPDKATKVTLIGSSLGGLTATWLGEQYLQVQRLVLLAPAFGFPSRWLNRLKEDEVKQWQEKGSLLVYHYGEKQTMPINYAFVKDAHQYDPQKLQRPVPTLILHGKEDEIVPIEYSRAYEAQRSWVKLVELDSDHGLTDVLSQIWCEIREFCQ
ncbi:MAG: YqiA/YcfP family alpha/beta fold hydrolase [Microcystaceae cyanobacterium]